MMMRLIEIIGVQITEQEKMLETMTTTLDMAVIALTELMKERAAELQRENEKTEAATAKLQAALDTIQKVTK